MAIVELLLGLGFEAVVGDCSGVLGEAELLEDEAMGR